MVLEVGVQVVYQQLLLQLLLHVGDDAEVEVHSQGGHLTGFPVLPQPPRDVEQNGLQQQQQHQYVIQYIRQLFLFKKRKQTLVYPVNTGASSIV